MLMGNTVVNLDILPVQITLIEILDIQKPELHSNIVFKFKF